MSQLPSDELEPVSMDENQRKKSFNSDQQSVQGDSISGLKRVRAEKIILNARGIRYDVLVSHLDKLPKSRLGKLKLLIEKIKKRGVEDESLMELCDDFDLSKNEYYFNKDPYVLNMVLNFYENDRLHVHDNTCVIFYGNELLYWGIDENRIESCCEFKYYDKKEEINQDIEIENTKKNEMIHDRREFSDNQRLEYIKKKIRHLMDKPSSSYYARVISL
jgi:hypothetical protein